MIAAGAITTVAWPGKRTKFLIPIAEVEREGVARPEPSPAPVKRRSGNGAVPRSEREAAVARILAVEEAWAPAISSRGGEGLVLLVDAGRLEEVSKYRPSWRASM